ncbi:MAG: DUF3795 domain-containing protein [Ruminococcus sp.]|jgi:hypothetical protein|nr:DUF3795 domain-containing protein [Ruminococcus sp.]
MEQKIAYCGLDCNACTIKETVLCAGCRESDGTYWDGICEIKECAVKLQKVEHCGNCKKFPCDTLLDISFDPETGDEGLRIERLKELSDRKVTLRDRIRPPLIGALIGAVAGIVVGAAATDSFDWFKALAGGDYSAIPNAPGSFAGYIAACTVIGTAIPLIIQKYRKEK